MKLHNKCTDQTLFYRHLSPYFAPIRRRAVHVAQSTRENVVFLLDGRIGVYAKIVQIMCLERTMNSDAGAIPSVDVSFDRFMASLRDPDDPAPIVSAAEAEYGTSQEKARLARRREQIANHRPGRAR